MFNLSNYLDAGYPCLAIETADESQVVDAVGASGADWFIYSATGNIVAGNGEESGEVVASGPYSAAFAFAAAAANRVVVILDAQALLANAPVYRSLLEALPALKRNGSAVILVAPFWKLPAELTHSLPVIRFDLPSRNELAEPLETVASAANVAINGNREALLDASAGLTRSEAENAFALSVVETGGELSADIVNREKMRTVSNTGYLQVTQAAAADSIGGLDLLKEYLVGEVKPHFRDLQLSVRGILLCGLPGTGKSLVSKAAASVLGGLPLIRFDVAACKGGIVGESEANIRNATRIIEAIAPCVLWIDEIEKAVGGFRSSAATDGGTTLGMVGHLLTWLQEHNKPIFTVATCNDFKALPVELTRAGRFNERFFVDLPNTVERESIASLHLARIGCDVQRATAVAQRTDGYTGAEIEALILSAARLTSREITLDSIVAASKSIRPVASIEPQAVAEFTEFAKSCLRPANCKERKPVVARNIRAN